MKYLFSLFTFLTGMAQAVPTYPTNAVRAETVTVVYNTNRVASLGPSNAVILIQGMINASDTTNGFASTNYVNNLIVPITNRLQLIENNTNNWNTAYSWGNHAGLYRLVNWVPGWNDVTNKPDVFVPAPHDYTSITNSPWLTNAPAQTTQVYTAQAGTAQVAIVAQTVQTELDPVWSAVSNSVTAGAALGATALQPGATNGIPHSSLSGVLGAGKLHVTASDTNKIATAWQNPASATNWTWTSDGVSATMTGYSGPADVVIPDKVDNLPVKSFGTIFSGVAITSISGGENVTSVGAVAFSGCTVLTSVILPSATSIGFGAFSGCSVLTSVILPSATSIEDEAFFFCSVLTSVILPSATSIEDEAFYTCPALTSAYFGQNAPSESFDVYTDSPSVTNYVTSPTATGWGATWGGRPVVRMPVTADRFTGGGTGITNIPLAGVSGLVDALAGKIATNGMTDTIHGARGGANLHSLADGSGAGFLSAVDYTAIAGMKARTNAWDAMTPSTGDVTRAGTLGGSNAVLSTDYMTLDQGLSLLGGRSVWYMHGGFDTGVTWARSTATDIPTTNWTVTIASATAGMYGPSWVVTNLSGTVIKAGVISISGIGSSFNSGGGRSASYKWEAYVTNTVTDGDMPEWSDQGSVKVLTGTADYLPMTIAILIPTNLPVGSALVLRPKVTAAANNPTITITGGSNSLSSVSLPTGIEANLGDRGATSIKVGSANSYNTETRELTVAAVSNTPAGIAAAGGVTNIPTLRQVAARSFGSSKGVLIGDSVTTNWGIGTCAIDDVLLTDDDRAAGNTCDNLGNPGYRIDEERAVWNALDSSTKSNYDYAVIMLGLNDVHEDWGFGTSMTNYQLLVNDVRSSIKSNGVVMIATMTPAALWFYDAGVYPGGTNRLAIWSNMNACIMGGGQFPITNADYRISSHTRAMDMTTLLPSSTWSGPGMLDYWCNTGDHAHPNTEGKRTIAYAYKSALRDAGFLRGSLPDNQISRSAANDVQWLRSRLSAWIAESSGNLTVGSTNGALSEGAYKLNVFADTILLSYMSSTNTSWGFSTVNANNNKGQSYINMFTDAGGFKIGPYGKNHTRTSTYDFPGYVNFDNNATSGGATGAGFTFSADHGYKSVLLGIITPSGDWGLGTNAPAAKLHVVGNTIIETNLTVKGAIISSSVVSNTPAGIAAAGGVITNSILGQGETDLGTGLTVTICNATVCYYAAPTGTWTLAMCDSPLRYPRDLIIIGTNGSVIPSYIKDLRTGSVGTTNLYYLRPSGTGTNWTLWGKSL